MAVTPSPSVSVVTPLFSKRRAGIAPCATVTSVRLAQFANEPSGRSEASQSTVSFFRPTMPSNAPVPMLVTDAGMVRSSIPAQLAKARSPMVVMDGKSST